MKKVIYILGFFYLLLGVSQAEASGLKKTQVKLDNKKFDVEVAITPEERNKGLMFREYLCPQCGMFFVFRYPSRLSFWMKNTLIPLDIVFIEKLEGESEGKDSKTKVIKGKVVDMATLGPCKKDQACIPYQTKKPAQYVLEVNAGTFTNVIGKTIKIKNYK